MISAHASTMLPAQASAPLDAWLAWFARHQQAACRAYKKFEGAEYFAPLQGFIEVNTRPSGLSTRS
jgi:hypothetical protein